MQTTSPRTPLLAEPQGDDRISNSTLSYVAESTRDELYDLVVRSCIETGISQARLAKRLGKDPAQINRILNSPGNWTIDTIAQLLFAINGSLLKAHSFLPMRQSLSNRQGPTCFGAELSIHTASDQYVVVKADTVPVQTFVGAR